MYTQEEINLIILSGITELSYKLKRVLLSDFEISEPDFKNHENLLIKSLSDGVYNKVKGKFYDPSYRREILNKLDNKGIKCVTLFSRDYPECLKNIAAPPILLYCKGDTSLLKSNCFAVVGSRKSNAKISADCKKLSGEISEFFTVVSGIAEGADCSAIEGALDAGGKVISVLANGFDRIYPACNAGLCDRIVKEGLLISEFTPDTLPQKYHFPVRNRIIAGLSRGVLVVSAGEKSGALITANYAVDYNRDVFALPYYRDNPLGKGCNFLLKNGAYLTENTLDIFRTYGLDFKKSEEKQLTETERSVYEAIKSLHEAFLPEVAQKLNKQPYELLALISSLEIKKYIIRLGGNRFSVV